MLKMMELDYSDLLKFVVFITVSSLGAWFVIYSTVEINTTQEDGKEVLELTQAEQSYFIRSRPVTTITFYEGDISKEFSLEDRIFLIIKKNSWLTSRLVSRKCYGRIKKDIIAVFSKFPSSDELSAYYEEILLSDKILSESMPFDKMSEATSDYLVKKGTGSVNKPDEVLFKLTLFKIYKENDSEKRVIKTALFMSISHVLVDGHSFYALYSFLDGSLPVRALNARRVENFAERLNQNRNIFYENLQKTPVLFTWVLISRVFEASSVTKVLRVKSDKIKEIKDEIQKKNSLNAFVSTNDILTSWFFRTVKCTYGFMAVNFRSRLSFLNENLAGNYESAIVYSSKDFESPLDIRSGLTSGDFHPKNTPFPSTLVKKYSFHPCVATNWSSFYTHLSFPGTKHLLHLPQMTLQGEKEIFGSMMAIFKINEKDLAVLLYVRPSSEDELLRWCDVNFLQNSYLS
jgi:hypothetical protein